MISKTHIIGIGAFVVGVAAAAPTSSAQSGLPSSITEQPTTPEGIEIMRRVVRRNAIRHLRMLAAEFALHGRDGKILDDGEGNSYTWEEAIEMMQGQRGATLNTTFVDAQNGDGPSAPQVQGADIVFTESEKDFGVVPEKSELVYRFTFKNVGSESLVIEKVNTGCGCTAAKLPKTEFEPGEVGHLDITYKPKGNGTQKRTIQILTNDAETRITTLLLKVEVIPIVAARPQTLQLGNVPLGEARSVEVEVVSRDKDMKVLGANCNGNEFKVDIVENPKPTGMMDPKLPGYGKVKVTLLGNANVGRLLRRLTIDVLASEADGRPQQNRTLGVSLFAQIKGHLTVEPPFVRVKPLRGGESFEREVVLYHDKGTQFEIVGDPKIVNSNIDADVTVEATEHNGKPAFRVKLSGRAGQVASRFRGQIQINTDVDHQEMISIDFSGLVRAARAAR